MSDRARTPELVLLGLVVVLAVGGLLLGGSGAGSRESRRPKAQEQISPARIARVERRVEMLRGLRFRRSVPVSVISAAQARRYGVADEKRTAQPAHERAEVEVEKLLGLLKPGVDVAKVTSAIYGEQVAGFYDPHRKQLMLVRGAGVDDVTLAHELTHALEDQHFGLEHAGTHGPPLERLSDDASTAYTALVEGTATEIMVQYMVRYPGSTPDLGAALSAATSGTPLPPYVMRGLLFPYLQGQKFVDVLRHGTSSWALVNVALRYRPPGSTAEVLDPERWLRVTRPAAVSLPVLSDRFVKAGWRAADSSTFGQFDTTQLLYATSGATAAQRIAAGWDGGRFELWRRGGWGTADADVRASCHAPCRSRDALVVAWRVKRPHAARVLASALGHWLAVGLHGLPRGRSGWQLPGGSVAVLRSRGLDVRVVLAPSARVAARLMR